MRSRKRGIAVIGVVLTAGLGSSSALGASVFTQRVDHLCAVAARKFDRFVPGATSRAFRREEEIGARLVAQLQRVAPPSAEANAYNTLIADQAVALHDADEAAAARGAGNRRAEIRDDKSEIKAAAREDAIARHLDLPACAKNAGTVHT